MALIRFGPMVADARGSIGGTTFSRNRSGAYTRGRVVPTNPNTTTQQQARANMTTAAQAWLALTATQRLNWNTYAANVNRTNPMGDAFKWSGQQAFCACNTMRLAVGLAILTAAPTTNTAGPGLTPTMSVTAASSTLVVSALAGYTPVAGGAPLIIRASDPQSPGVSYFKGPFYTVVAAQYKTGTVPPFNGTLRNAAPAGSVIFVRLKLCTPDGRVGPEQTFPVVAA